MGDLTSDWEEPGQFAPQGGPPAVKYEYEEGRNGNEDLSTSGRGNEGSGAGGGGYVCPLTPEYSRPIYHHSADNGDMSGSGATAGGAGVNDFTSRN